MSEETHNVNWRLMIAFNQSNRAINRRTRAAGLTPGQPKILQYLTGNAGCTQKAIGDGCAIDKSTVTGLLARMEADGLIRREPCAGSRRELRVFLTDAGREGARRVLANSDDVDEVALADLSAAERAELADMLDRLAQNLARDNGAAR